jgi:uncharacterized damage-inducible protein DinB
MDGELQRIVGGLRRVYEGGAWHGPSVVEALDGVRAADAAARPVPSAHTIHELTHHIAAWKGEVTRRLEGGEPGEPADGDWPDPGVVVDQSRWEAVTAMLAARQVALLEAVLAFDADRLGEPVGSAASVSLGAGGSFRAMLHGSMQHDAYHAGQIVLLKKALHSA